MHRAFSFPMTAERGRNKERLEASLAGLCELELLRQRQERLVLGALSLGDIGPALGDLLPPLTVPAGLSRLPDDLTLRRQLNGLHSAPWGLMATLAQLMGEMRADLEPQVIMGDSRPNSGLYELSEGCSPGGGTDQAPPVLRDPTPTCVREARRTSAGERPRSISDIFVAKREGALDPHPAVPRSLSAQYEGGPWGPGPEVGPTVEDFREALRVEGYILGLLQRRTPRLPRTTSGPESRSLSRQSSLRHPNLQHEILTTSSSFPPGQPNLQPETLTPSPSFHLGYLNPHPKILATSLTLPHQSSPHSAVRPSVSEPPCNSESNYSPEFLRNYLPESPQHTSTLLPSPDQLVSAEYIPPSCQPPTLGKPSQTTCSPERSPPICQSQALPRKGRSSEVDSSAPRRTGRREGRSQSENSLLGQRRGYGDRKCSTVDRDGGWGLRDRHRRALPAGILGYRRWRSSQELSQDEAVGPREHSIQRPPRKPRRPPPPYPYRHGEEVGLDFGVPATGELDSSLSEGESPGPSSLSTDSDDSGGLVWPQQLPPQLAPLSDGPARQKAFVKIKASHALKKKILRFRTGSLKVMTTV